MTFYLVLIAIVALAVLAPRYGVDSRGLTDRAGGPPDVLPDPKPDQLVDNTLEATKSAAVRVASSARPTRPPARNSRCA